MLNLEEKPVKSTEEVLEWVKRAIAKRATAETKMNKASSRSHCVFTINMQSRELNDEGEEVLRVGKLNLVDLAGRVNDREIRVARSISFGFCCML